MYIYFIYTEHSIPGLVAFKMRKYYKEHLKLTKLYIVNISLSVSSEQGILM